MKRIKAPQFIPDHVSAGPFKGYTIRRVKSTLRFRVRGQVGMYHDGNWVEG